MFNSSTRILLLLGVLGIACRNDAYDYCQHKCENYTHVMCKYPPGPNKETCIGYMNITLTEKEKEKILNDHNVYRQKLALGTETVGNIKLPPASNMLQLLWDEELSHIAQRIVDQCPRKPALEKCIYTDRFQVNHMMVTLENMQDINLLAQEIVKSWYSAKDKLTLKELQDLSPNPDKSATYNVEQATTLFNMPYHDTISYRRSRMHLSYTQIIWAKSEFIGCARSAWLTDGYTPSQQIVCVYGPAGNIMNHEVYKQGTACSQCPLAADCSKQYQGLCVRFLS